MVKRTEKGTIMMIQKMKGFTGFTGLTGFVMAGVVMSSLYGSPALAESNGVSGGHEVVINPNDGTVLQPVRMAKATAVVYQQSFSVSPDGHGYVTNKKICEVSSEIPVFDARNT